MSEGSRHQFDTYQCSITQGLAGHTFVPNNRVACSPFESLAIETSGSAFKTVKQKNSLLRLSVVAGNERYLAGTYVYVRGDVITMPWTKEIFELDGTKFIIVPEEAIQLVTYFRPGGV
jgi:hypothetical protein